LSLEIQPTESLNVTSFQWKVWWGIMV